MLIVLFLFEMIIVGLTIFTTRMVEHKYKAIQESLSMYCSKRTYKTKADIDFIESIVKTYTKLINETNHEPDLESAIRRKLQNENIGKFSYASVKNLAVKAKNLMWGVLIIEILIAWMNHIATDAQAVIIIAASLLLTVMMAMYGIVKGIDERGEALIDEIIHYVRNIYPLEHKEKKKAVQAVNIKKKTVSEEKEDGEKDINIKKSEVKKAGSELSAKDIAHLLEHL